MVGRARDPQEGGKAALPSLLSFLPLRIGAPFIYLFVALAFGFWLGFLEILFPASGHLSCFLSLLPSKLTDQKVVGFFFFFPFFFHSLQQQSGGEEMRCLSKQKNLPSPTALQESDVGAKGP